MLRPPPQPPLFPYTTLFRSEFPGPPELLDGDIEYVNPDGAIEPGVRSGLAAFTAAIDKLFEGWSSWKRSEEHTSELQSHHDLVCRLLLEKKKALTKVSSVHL